MRRVKHLATSVATERGALVTAPPQRSFQRDRNSTTAKTAPGSASTTPAKEMRMRASSIAPPIGHVPDFGTRQVVALRNRQDLL
jgi:hypothetical protein